MERQPKIGIIIVNFNGYKDTIDCLNSLRKITYSNYVIIVVDNASNNESVAELKKTIHTEVLLCSESNTGFSGGNNIGIKYALEHDCDYCLLLNNDTEVDQDFLSFLVEVAEQSKGKTVVTPKIRYYSDKTKIWYAGGMLNNITSRTNHIGINETDEGQYDESKPVTFVSGCCMLIPREIVDSVGLMEESFFLYCEDLEYCLRITGKGFELRYEPHSIIYHKVNASTGKASNLVTYYTVRNKMYIIRSFFKGWRKIPAIIYALSECMKRVLFGEYKLSIVIKGFKDYARKVIGPIPSSELK